MTKSLWFTVNQDGKETVHNRKPVRHRGGEPVWVIPNSSGTGSMVIPTGSIREITGQSMTWEDEAIEWKPKLY